MSKTFPQTNSDEEMDQHQRQQHHYHQQQQQQQRQKEHVFRHEEDEGEGNDDDIPMLGSSLSRPARPWCNKLNICMFVIGFLCLAVIGGVLAVFFVFFEACVDPHTVTWNNISYFDTSDQVLLMNVNVSGSISMAQFPNGAEPDRIDTRVLLSATSQEALASVITSQLVGPAVYSLSFSRPPTYRTLETCNTEDVTFSISPRMNQSLSATFIVESGFVEVKTIEYVAFQNFSVVIHQGPISVGVVWCVGLSLFAGSGEITLGASDSSAINITSLAGDVHLNGPTGISFDVSSQQGSITATGISVSPLALNGYMKLITLKGNIDVALINIQTTAAFPIQLYTESGDIKAAVRGFSGSFRASTVKGTITIPGFDNCLSAYECEGTWGPNGAQNQIIEVITHLGDIELIFV